MAELTALGLTLAAPYQDQADRGQSRAVISPLYLADHEARRRPMDDAGALTDPEQAERDREEAGDRKRLTHGGSFVRVAAPSSRLAVFVTMARSVTRGKRRKECGRSPSKR